MQPAESAVGHRFIFQAATLHGSAEHLETLARLHVEKRPDDPWGNFYLAEAAFLRDQWQEAVDRFLVARESTDDAEVLDLIDFPLTGALFELGQFERAFELTDPDEDVFVYLADIADGRRSLPQLEQILDLYKFVGELNPTKSRSSDGRWGAIYVITCRRSATL